MSYDASSAVCDQLDAPAQAPGMTSNSPWRSIQSARFLRQHDRDAVADRIGELGLREISSCFSASYSSGPLVSGQTRISSSFGSTLPAGRSVGGVVDMADPAIGV